MDTARIHDFAENIRLAAFFGCAYIVSSVGEAHPEDKAVASNKEVPRLLEQTLSRQTAIFHQAAGSVNSRAGGLFWSGKIWDGMRRWALCFSESWFPFER